MKIEDLKVGMWFKFYGYSSVKLFKLTGEKQPGRSWKMESIYGEQSWEDSEMLTDSLKYKPWEPQVGDPVHGIDRNHEEFGKLELIESEGSDSRNIYFIEGAVIGFYLNELEPCIESKVDDKPEFQVGDEVMVSEIYSHDRGNYETCSPYKGTVMKQYSGAHYKGTAVDYAVKGDVGQSERFSMARSMKHIQKETLKTINFDLQAGESESKRVAMMLEQERIIGNAQVSEDFDCEEHEDSLDGHGRWMDDFQEQGWMGGGRNQITGSWQ